MINKQPSASAEDTAGNKPVDAAAGLIQKLVSGVSFVGSLTLWFPRLVFATAFLMVAVVLLEAFASPRLDGRFPYLHFGDGPPGVILVGTPNVYTRERLINARLRNREWLEEQFRLTRFAEFNHADRDRFEFLHFSSSQALARRFGVTASVSEAEESEDQVPRGGAAQDVLTVDPSGTPAVPVPKLVNLPTSLQYEALHAFRAKVEHEWLKTQLDDRHDIEGNTIYQLAFDASLLIPSGQIAERADKVAVIEVVFHRELEASSIADEEETERQASGNRSQRGSDTRAKDGNAESTSLIENLRHYELWQDWRNHLEPVIQDAVFQRTTAFVGAHERQTATALEQAQLIEILENSLTDDPYTQVILASLQSDSSYPMENKERRRRLLNYVAEYRSHNSFLNEYESVQRYLQALALLCDANDGSAESIGVLPEACAAFKPFRGPNADSLPVIEYRFDQRPPQFQLARQTLSSSEPPSSPRSQSPDLLQFRPLLCGAANDDGAQNGKYGLARLVQKSNASESVMQRLCASPAQPTSQERLHPLVALLQARNIIWAMGPREEQLESGRYFPFVKAVAAHWLWKESESDWYALSESIETGLKGNSFEDSMRLTLDQCERGNIRGLGICPGSEPDFRTWRIAIAALTIEDLNEKGLDQFFRLELAQCQHGSCTVQLEHLDDEWPSVAEYREAMRIRTSGESSQKTFGDGHTKFENFKHLLSDRTEVYAYDVKGEVVRPGIQQKAWSDEFVVELLVNQAGKASGQATGGLENRGDSSEALANEEVLGYSVALDTLHQTGLKHAVFGWIISPKKAWQGGVRGYPLSALISAPSWWRSAHLQIGTCWMEIKDAHDFFQSRKGLSPTAGEAHHQFDGSCLSEGASARSTHVIRLPGNERSLSHKLRIQVVDEPNLQGLGVEQALGGVHSADVGNGDSVEGASGPIVTAGRRAQVVLFGDRLWRNPRVFLGSQMADSIQVLPDMSGLIAQFRCIANPTSFAVQAPDPHGRAGLETTEDPIVSLPIRVWTSEGNTQPQAVTIQPFHSHRGEPPCYLEEGLQGPESKTVLAEVSREALKNSAIETSFYQRLEALRQVHIRVAQARADAEEAELQKGLETEIQEGVSTYLNSEDFRQQWKSSFEALDPQRRQRALKAALERAKGELWHREREIEKDVAAKLKLYMKEAEEAAATAVLNGAVETPYNEAGEPKNKAAGETNNNTVGEPKASPAGEPKASVAGKPNSSDPGKPAN